ncbi:hypothetical protein [Alistipes indistinctus]|uniref:hypothetical protein n=1 Tax=Alistipes indistinctus TaxID=626932 RepID=UPI0015F243E1|nr:hypothetical protein [Alistipes indistinctus]BCD55447.1 hypothetical protein AI2BBH_P450 [Alistipes indistinctus]
MPDNTISLFKLKSKLNAFTLDKFTYSIAQNSSLKIINNRNPKYVEPIFSRQSLEETSFDNATIVLISAAGATGKTCLTENLSNDLDIPIFDLSKHDPVASNSLTGLLFNSMELSDFTDYSQKLQTGKASMIIDALDEGYIKTTVDGFYAFLDNIVKIAATAQGTPFVLLGRTNVVELTTLYLEEQGIKVAFLQIEPFTIDSAKIFIDKHVESEAKERFVEQYKAVRDYIVDAIGGFFKNQSEINHKQYLQFIGYAPVLLAISTLLNKNNNYHALLEDLKSNNRQNVKLVIDIIEEILKRDKKDKINELLLPQLLNNRPDSFKEVVFKNAYSIEEQCIRLLCKQLNINLNISVTQDAYFDTEYNKQISSWLNEHPFLSGGKIQNVVFESYIIARLIKITEYKDYVFQYLRSSFRSAYMLFYIYDELAKDRTIDKEFIPYLFGSLKALDKKGHYSSMELTVQKFDKTTHDIICELEFFKAEVMTDDYSYTFTMNCSDTLYIGTEITNMTIDLPVTVGISADKVDCTPPAYIKCNTIECAASEILLNAGMHNESVVFECNNFCVKCSNKGTLPILTNKGHMDGKQLQLICKNQLSYPFVQYSAPVLEDGIPTDINDKYQKMRRLLLMFRSHSKGDLARYKDKIDNRIGNSSIGKKVLDALIEKGILYSKEMLYFIDIEKMAQELGVKYDDIRSSIINDKIKHFLANI